MENLVCQLEKFYRSYYSSDDLIPLHRPVFLGAEKEYLQKCIDTTFVSSVGEFVQKFSQDLAAYSGAKYAVPIVNGTSALHLALYAKDVRANCEVITQPLTFVATANAIRYLGAAPVFIDIDRNTCGLSPLKLKDFIATKTETIRGQRFNKKTGRRVKVCVPVHAFGYPCLIEEIQHICSESGIELVEDAAESLGSWSGKTHTGLFGDLGVISFNGNKILTTGGGGAILTNDEPLAKELLHLSTTAKEPHKWEYKHDCVGFNYRMPNINAALGCAQLEKLPEILAEKRSLNSELSSILQEHKVGIMAERGGTSANHWLATALLPNKQDKLNFLELMNARGLQSRPAWDLLPTLSMFSDCEHDGMDNARQIFDRVVNIPSWPAEDRVH